MDNPWNESDSGLRTAFSSSAVGFEFQASPEARIIRSDSSPVTSDDRQPWRGPATLFPEEHGIDLAFARGDWELCCQDNPEPPNARMRDDGEVIRITTMPFYRTEERHR